MAEETTPEWVTLVSSDGFEFIIQREPAIVAGTIRRMLDPKSAWTGNPDVEHADAVYRWLQGVGDEDVPL
jgi:hypothetical protein